MKCITSPALDDAQIVAYVDGEADDSVVTHIKACPFCSEKARQWTLLQNRLQKQLYRATCPTPIELGDYELGLLAAPQALVVASHLRGCPHCRREVSELQEFLTKPDARPNIFHAANVLFAQLIGGAAAPGLGALRGDDKGPLIFEADGVVITLDVQPGLSGQISILGQLAANDQEQWTGAEVALQQRDSSQLTTSLDDLGAFRLDPVLPGASQITIRSSHGIAVHIPNIDIAL